MIDIEVIKKTLSNNTTKTISQNVLKRLVLARVADARFIPIYDIERILEQILQSNLSIEKQQELTQLLFVTLKDKITQTRKGIEGLFSDSTNTDNGETK